MEFVFQFSIAWYGLFGGFLLAWIALTILRRKQFTKREAKEQFIIGLLGLCALVLMELFATSTNLWYYVPNDWPVILWPTYFVAILFGYQLLRVVEYHFGDVHPSKQTSKVT